MLIVLLVNLYDTCLIYYQEKILTLTHYAGRQCQVGPSYFCPLLPASKPAQVYDKERAVGQTFMIFVFNAHATFTAQRMAGR